MFLILISNRFVVVVQGIPCIHALFHDIASDVSALRGVIVAVPCVNVYGYQMQQREYLDDVDLNRVFPGKVCAAAVMA